MKLKDHKLSFTDNSPAKQQIKDACAFIKENWTQCKNDLMYTLLEVQNVNEDGKKEKKISDIDRHNLISYLTDSITNLSLQLNGKGTQCRYSNHAILWFKSATNSHDRKSAEIPILVGSLL